MLQVCRARQARSPGGGADRLLTPTVARFDPRPSGIDRYVATLDVADLAQPLLERAYLGRPSVRRVAADEPNHRHRPLLCARRERPRSRTAEKRDERAPVHSITSSARSSTF